MIINSDKINNDLIVCFCGNLTFENSLGLAERLVNLVDFYSVSNVVINLKNCNNISTLGYAGLISFRLNSECVYKKFILQDTSEEIQKQALLLRMDRLFVFE